MFPLFLPTGRSTLLHCVPFQCKANGLLPLSGTTRGISPLKGTGGDESFFRPTAHMSVDERAVTSLRSLIWPPRPGPPEISQAPQIGLLRVSTSRWIQVLPETSHRTAEAMHKVAITKQDRGSTLVSTSQLLRRGLPEELDEDKALFIACVVFSRTQEHPACQQLKATRGYCATHPVTVYPTDR